MDWTPITHIVVPSAVVSALITAAIHHFFESRRARVSRLFDTKRTVYADVVSTIHYPFQRDGMTNDEFRELVRAVSAARILASDALRDLLEGVFLVADEMEHAEHPAEREQLLLRLGPLRTQIEQEMRRELGVR